MPSQLKYSSFHDSEKIIITNEEFAVGYAALNSVQQQELVQELQDLGIWQTLLENPEDACALIMALGVYSSNLAQALYRCGALNQEVFINNLMLTGTAESFTNIAHEAGLLTTLINTPDIFETILKQLDEAEQHHLIQALAKLDNLKDLCPDARALVNIIILLGDADQSLLLQNLLDKNILVEILSPADNFKLIINYLLSDLNGYSSEKLLGVAKLLRIALDYKIVDIANFDAHLENLKKQLRRFCQQEFDINLLTSKPFQKHTLSAWMEINDKWILFLKMQDILEIDDICVTALWNFLQPYFDTVPKITLYLHALEPGQADFISLFNAQARKHADSAMFILDLELVLQYPRAVATLSSFGGLDKIDRLEIVRHYSREFGRETVPSQYLLRNTRLRPSDTIENYYAHKIAEFASILPSLADVVLRGCCSADLQVDANPYKQALLNAYCGKLAFTIIKADEDFVGVPFTQVNQVIMQVDPKDQTKAQVKWLNLKTGKPEIHSIIFLDGEQIKQGGVNAILAQRLSAMYLTAHARNKKAGVPLTLREVDLDLREIHPELVRQADIKITGLAANVIKRIPKNVTVKAYVGVYDITDAGKAEPHPSRGFEGPKGSTPKSLKVKK